MARKIAGFFARMRRSVRQLARISEFPSSPGIVH